MISRSGAKRNVQPGRGWTGALRSAIHIFPNKKGLYQRRLSANAARPVTTAAMQFIFFIILIFLNIYFPLLKPFYPLGITERQKNNNKVGSEKQNSEPSSGLLLTQICCPWAWIISRAIASP